MIKVKTFEFSYQSSQKSWKRFQG